MLSGAQPCFQLLRIGSAAGGDSARDLYTFRPALSRSVFRLGRAAELCDVTLDSSLVSRIHAELHAHREGGGGEEDEDGGGGDRLQEEDEGEGWTVHIKDRSNHGTWVNEVRLQPGVQWELSDGDTLTFGSQSSPGSPEFYFLFQKVKVRPLDFDAITIPKAGTFSSDLQNRIRTSLDRKAAASLDLSKLSINRATVILNSIGSLSKMRGSAWTFKRSDGQGGGGGGNTSDPGGSSSSPTSSSSSVPVGFPSSSSSSLRPPSTPPAPPSFPTAGSIPSSSSSSSSAKPLPTGGRSRRKSAHTVLLEDDSSDESKNRRAFGSGGGGRGEGGGALEDGQRARGRKRRRLYKSESDTFHPVAAALPLQPKGHGDSNNTRRPFTAAPSQRPQAGDPKPFPVGTRTIGSYHGAMTNSKLSGDRYHHHHHHHPHHPLHHHHHHQAMFKHPQDTETMHHIRVGPNGSVPVFRQHQQQRGAYSSSSSASSGVPRGRRRANSSPVVCSPLVVGGESYTLASPSVRICAEERGRMQFQRFHHLPSGKRRGRPRKHPLPPRPSLPSPSSSSSSSTSSASSESSGSSSSSSSSSSSEDEEEGGTAGGTVEPCAAPRCRLPQQDTVQWIQCDVCDAWYHIDCLHIDRKKLLMDPSAEFHCGCH